MPVYTPLGGSWLNMAESIQRILKRRALEGSEPTHPDQIIGWLEAVAMHWNRRHPRLCGAGNERHDERGAGSVVMPWRGQVYTRADRCRGGDQQPWSNGDVHDN